MLSRVVVVVSTLLFAASSVSAQDVVSDCPIPNGYFADSLQCDKYYECIDNKLTEKLCDDGFAFNDFNHKVEKCDFIYQVDCETRPDLQPPQATPSCPRANGYFPHSEPGRCEEFYFCSQGKGNHLTCPASLVFSLITGTCVWPDESGRTDNCKSINVVNFTCPTVPIQEAVAHPRYADPDDCQYFYVCINGKTPRRNGCKFGQVFNTKIGACDLPKEVPECSDYYFDYFTEYFASLGTSQVPSPEILQAAVSSGFKVPEIARRIRVRPTGSASISNSDGVRRRRPLVKGAPRPVPKTPFDGPQSTDVDSIGVPPSPSRHSAQDRASGTVPAPRPAKRKRPSTRLTARATTTTTTTTTPEPAIYDDYTPAEGGDYVYYDDYPEGTGAAAPPAAAAPQEPANAALNKFSLSRQSART